MKESQPLFSLVVPVYNVESYLGQCLDSIVAQTNRNFEVILVDDGSTDSSGKLADAFQEENSDAFPIRVVHQTNQGLSAARNCGISHASGEYILCIDSDDYIVPETLEALQEKLREAPYDAPYDMVFFRFQEFDENGAGIIRPVSFPDVHSFSVEGALEALFSKHLENYAWSFVAKRRLYRDIHFPVGRNYEDKATTYRLMAVSNRVGLLDRDLYRYRQRQESIVHNVAVADINSELKNCEEQRAFLRGHFPQLLDVQSAYYAYEFLVDYRNCSISRSLQVDERRNSQLLIANRLRELASQGTHYWNHSVYFHYLLIRLHLLAPLQRIKSSMVKKW